MRLALLLPAALFCSCVTVPPVFGPSIHADGSRTWTFSVPLHMIPAADMALPRKERDEKQAGYMVGSSQFCEKGWEIAESKEENRVLTISGRCI